MIEEDQRSHSLDSVIGAASANHGSTDHNINVVIRVRPIITAEHLAQQNAAKPSRTASNISNRTKADKEDADQSTGINFPAAGQIQVQDTIANTVRSFAFNVVFEPEATQEEVFEHSGVKRLVDMALDGLFFCHNPKGPTLEMETADNSETSQTTCQLCTAKTSDNNCLMTSRFACTVFAYGQTSTGKTYTLTGNAFQNVEERNGTRSSMSSRRCPSKAKNKYAGQINLSINQSNCDEHVDPSTNIGIVQLSFAYLFEQIKRRNLRDKTLYVITVSYLEVYNEQVLDLLNPSPRSLNVRWRKDRGFYAENLFKVECEDIGDLEGVLEEGCKNRQVRSHSMNENSSRSHAVMTITLSSEMPDPDDSQGFIRKEGRFCLVDLAGSEKTKRTNSKGGTFVEANNINRSLLVLGNCIACLADPKRRNCHIPYRDSTLTKLLADSLSGNGMTLMISCVSPQKCDSQETISTLRYASRAKRVRMNPVVQMDPRELLILSLKREVRLLRMENKYLRQNHFQQILSKQSNELGQTNSSDRNALVLTTINNNEDSHLKNGDGDNQLLTKYMRDNEVLRVENVQLNLQRNRLIRDHELVCRENERLLKKLHSFLSRVDNSQLKPLLIASIQSIPPLSTSASSPSLLSFVSEEDSKRLYLGPNSKPNLTDSKVAQDQSQLPAGHNQIPESERQYHLSKMEHNQHVVSLEHESDDKNGFIIIKVKEQHNRDVNKSAHHSSHHSRIRTATRVIDESSKSYPSDNGNVFTPDLTIRGTSAMNKTRIYKKP